MVKLIMTEKEGGGIPYELVWSKSLQVTPASEIETMSAPSTPRFEPVI